MKFITQLRRPYKAETLRFHCPKSSGVSWFCGGEIWYITTMDRQKRIGIIIIIVGICLPLITLPFLSGYAKEKGIFENLYRVGIELKRDKQDGAGNSPPANIEKPVAQAPAFLKLIPKRIPFRFFLVITLILFYIGIVKISAASREQESQIEEHK